MDSIAPHTERQPGEADLLLQIATFDHKQDRVPKYNLQTFDELAAGLRHVASPEKNGSAISAGLFNGTRSSANVTARVRILLDIEMNEKTGAVPPSPEIAAERIRSKGWRGVIYTSHSHTPDLPRYRVILAIDAPFHVSPDAEQHAADLELDAYAVEMVAERLELDDVLDTSKRNPASLFYRPRCPADMMAHARVIDIAGSPIKAVGLYAKAMAKRDFWLNLCSPSAG